MGMSYKHRLLPARLDASGVVVAYNRIAPIYDIWGGLAESRAHDHCLDWLDLQGVRVVLDVATGTGSLLGKVMARAPGATGIGIDLSPEMLRRAARRSSSKGRCYELLRGDARHLPIRSGVIDLLLNSYMFDLLPESEFAVVLREFSRVLAPGGRLALINMTVPERLTERFWERLYKIHPPLLGGCRGVLLSGPLTEAGFVIEQRSRVSQLGFPSEVILARRPAGPGRSD
jgi:ubiquinone/menaquinone biosynthesis C-methylase UbiE